ncbi:MAG TPA: hypothetical protein VHO02_05085, partial [Fibrobacteria bacterium]|nr:hypothetical protein [Fibrobacteria bacterium]
MPATHISPRALLALALAACVLSLFPSSASAREQVLEDSPSRLVIEVDVPEYHAEERDGRSRLVSPGYPGASEAGAPDLPHMGFWVATGDRMPSVTVEPLEWTEVGLPGGLAGVPFWVNSLKSEPRHDAAKFAAARGLIPEVSAFDTYRGMKMRHISVPMATYTEGETRARALKRFRVRVDFPNPGAVPNPGAAKWLKQAGVMNPVGGAHLAALPRSAPLRKASAASSFDRSAPWLKIRIGNRIVDDFAEDGMYALSYEAAAAKGLPAGVKIGQLRIYSGPQDTATLALAGAIAPTLSEIPIEVHEAAPANGTFDTGDTVLFYAHGTSLWVPIDGGTLPDVRWIFKLDPWSFENYYFLQWSGSEAGVRLKDSTGSGATDTVTSVPHYLRAERELTGGTCDLSSQFDDEASVSRYWYTRYSCVGAGGAVSLASSQLTTPSWNILPERVSDSVWIGFFTPYGGSNASNSFAVWKNRDLIPFQFASGIEGSWYAKTTGYDDAPPRALFDSVRWNAVDPAFEGYTVRYARSLKWSEGRLVFPAPQGGNVAYKLDGVPAGGRVLRVEKGVGTRWLTLQAVGGVSVFSDSTAVGDTVTYLLTRQALPIAADAITAETGPTGDRVVQDLRDGTIGGSSKNPDYL